MGKHICIIITFNKQRKSIKTSLFTQQVDGYLLEKKTKCAEGKSEWLSQSVHKTAILSVYILQDIGQLQSVTSLFF